MGGFPLADSLYYDDPGPMMAGWLGMQASGELSPRKVTTPPGSVLLRPRMRDFESLSALATYLKADHRPGYWYRGQTKRFSCVYRGEIPKLSACLPHVREISITFEGVIPTSYRRVVASQPAAWHLIEGGLSRLPLLTPAIRAIAASDNWELGRLRRDTWLIWRERGICS